MYRNTDSTCLVGDSPGNGLAYPPSCISTEFKAFVIIKLFYCFNKAKVAFLNQIKKQHAASNIAFGNAYNKSQICFRQAAFSILALLVNFFQQLFIIILKFKVSVKNSRVFFFRQTAFNFF